MVLYNNHVLGFACSWWDYPHICSFSLVSAETGMIETLLWFFSSVFRFYRSTSLLFIPMISPGLHTWSQRTNASTESLHCTWRSKYEGESLQSSSERNDWSVQSPLVKESMLSFDRLKVHPHNLLTAMTICPTCCLFRTLQWSLI